MIGRPTTSCLELSFRPNPVLISAVRCFIEDFFGRATADSDAAQRLALVAHELLENAAKYSSDGDATLTVRVDPGSNMVAVRTKNLATPTRIAEVEDAFRALSSAPDANGFYAEAMHRTAVRTSGSGGLGLARIWAEADMRPRLSIKGDRVEIDARGKIRGR
jgi:two-component sensor histidine kinase